MTHQPSRRHRFFALLVLVLFISVMIRGAWMHFFSSEPPLPPPVSPKTIQPMSATEGSETTPEALTEAVSIQESRQTAKRIVHVPSPSIDIMSYEEQINLVTSENVYQLSTSVLEKALGGELDAATSLRRLRWLCGLTNNSEAVYQFQLNSVMLRASARGPSLSTEGYTHSLTGGDGISIMIYPTEKQNRDYLSRWHEQCGHVRALFNQELRRRLEELARDGHVMARYLYASWKPSMTIDAGLFERITEWHLNAIDFSYANLEERELAGLVALGESYIFSGFTARNYRLGMLILNAALNCGLESSAVERRAQHGDLGALPDESTEEVEALMMKLESYCP